MKLELEVLASTAIKRKKPWPQLAWIGEVRESIFLLDARRLSVLYVPSGKTKRSISKLQPLLDNILVYNYSRNGYFIGGLLQSGDLFLWHKDTDMLKYIQGVPEFANPVMSTSADQRKPVIYISDDGSKMLVVLGNNDIYVWEMNPGQELFAMGPVNVKGCWSFIAAPSGMLLPQPHNTETSISISFHVDQVLGSCCSCMFLFNSDDSHLCVTKLLLCWAEPRQISSYGCPLFSADWKCMKHKFSDLVPGAKLVRRHGAYITSHSFDGHLLAVAVNTESTPHNRMLFISTYTDTVLVASMHGCGMRTPVHGRSARSYWVSKIAWTCDSLFVACITKQGALCILSRLGEPLPLISYGHSLDMGPRLYLPLHPLIIVQNRTGGDELNESLLTLDPMKQRFSVATHPRLPLILCSDGYLVTVLQLPGETSCLGILKGLVMESSKHLEHIRDRQRSITTMNSLNANCHNGKRSKLNKRLGFRVQEPSDVQHKVFNKTLFGKYQFEEPEQDALNQTIDDDLEDFVKGSKIKSTNNIDCGKIIFGDMDNMNTTIELESVNEEGMATIEMIKQAQDTMVHAWSLAVSHTGVWTEAHEDVLSNLVNNMAELFALILRCDNAELTKLQLPIKLMSKGKKNGHKNLKVLKVLFLVKDLFHLLRLDSVYKHLVVVALKLAHATLSVVLTSDSLRQEQHRVLTLHGCYTLMVFIERMLGLAYTDSSRRLTSHPCSLPQHNQAFTDHLYHPAISYNEHQSEISHLPPEQFADSEVADESSETESQQAAACTAPLAPGYQKLAQACRHLAPTWRLLYQQIVHSYRLVVAAGRRSKKKERCDILLHLMGALQCKLQLIGQSLVPPHKHLVYPGERLFIEGCPVPAMQAWVHTLHKAPDISPTKISFSRLLHAVLYTLLLEEELRSAVELVELLIRQQDVKAAVALYRQDRCTKNSVLTLLQQMPLMKKIGPPCYIQNAAVCKLVQSMARIMAAYFSNLNVYVYPPHAPHRIPPLTARCRHNQRVLPLYAAKLSNVIRRAGLSAVWTPDRALEYLLLTGLLSEAAWFAHRLGDWKTAFTISSASCQHQQRCSFDHGIKLPTCVQPMNILQTKLSQLLHLDSPGCVGLDVSEDDEQLITTIRDILRAAVIADTDLTPWLLRTVVDRLKHVAGQMSALVPDGFYLPAPPVYCPQPPKTEHEIAGQGVKEELQHRQEASSLVRLYLVVLGCSYSLLPSARWYAKCIFEAVGKGFKLSEEGSLPDLDVPILQESFINNDSPFRGQENDQSIRPVLESFRDFCSLTWMFHARDKLSAALRQKLMLAKEKILERAVGGLTWEEHVRECLDWAKRLVVFKHVLMDSSHLYSVLLSLIMELPHTKSTAATLAQYFHDPDELDPEIQDRLQSLLKEWQCTFLEGSRTPRGSIRVEGLPGKSPRGVSLSVLYHHKARKIIKKFHKKAERFGEYEVFVFDPETEALETGEDPENNSLLSIGSRPFESMDSYLIFLDTFFAVCFHRAVDCESLTTHQKPMLCTYADAIRETELSSIAYKAVAGLQRRQSMSRSSTPRNIPNVFFEQRQSLKLSNKPQLPVSPRARVGLFRSRSFSEILSRRKKKWTERAQSFSPVRRASSQNDLEYSFDSSLQSTSRPAGSAILHPRKMSSSEVIEAAKRMESSITGKINGLNSLNLTGNKDGEKLPDALVNPVLPPWLLEEIEFGPKYNRMEQMMEWMTCWVKRNHHFSVTNNHSKEAADTSPVIRLQMHPQLMVYALWQVDHQPQPPPKKPSAQAAANPQASPDLSSRTETTQVDYQPGHQPRNTNNNQGNMSNTPRGSSPRSADVSLDDSSKVDYYDVNPYANINNNHGDLTTPRSGGMQQDVVEVNMEEMGGGKKSKKKGKKKKSLSFKEGDVSKDERPRSRDQFRKQKAVTPAEESNISESSLNVSSLREEDLASSLQASNRMRMSELDVRDGNQDDRPPTRNQDHRPTSPERDVFVVPNPKKPAKGQGRGQRQEEVGVNTTLPHPRDAESGMLADQFKDIVRQEMRRVLQAQQQGVLAMLDVLDGDGPSPEERRTHPDRRSRRDNFAAQAPHEYTVMSVHGVEQRVSPEKSSTDLDVTPLPSDEELASVGSAPLTLSELDLHKLKPHKQPQNHHQPGVRTALHELKQLENQTPGGANLPHSSTVPSGKENVPLGMPHQMGPLFNQHQIPDTGQPFSRVMNMLRHMNLNMAHGIPPTMAYSGLSAAPTDNSLHLPHIPQTTAAAASHQARPSGFTPMPLLQLSQGRYPNLDEVPVRDTSHLPHMPQSSQSYQPSLSFGHHIPLLHLPGRPQMFSHIEDIDGVPRLIPPEEVIAFEQNKRLQQQQKEENSAQIRRQVAAQIAPPIGSQLLKADVQSFQVGDDRGTGKRSQRRAKKEADSRLKNGMMLKRMKSRDKMETDRLSTTYEEPELLETSELGVQVAPDEKDVHSEGVQTSARSPRKSLSKDEVDKSTEEPAPKLHSGYALTPGMFDEYLKHQDELGSDADTVAKLHYRAVMGTQTKEETRDAGMQTDDQLRQLALQRSLPPGTDAARQSIDDYIAAKKAVNGGGLLPPDIFMGLRFGDAGSPSSTADMQQSDSGRAFINVVDIMGSDMDEWVKSVPTRDERFVREEVERKRAEKPSSRSASPIKRIQEEPVRDDEGDLEERKPGPDPVTEQILGRSEPVTANDMFWDARSRTKETIRGRLHDMDAQFQAIHHMSEQMEEDYKNTKLMMHTIEQLNEARVPSEPLPAWEYQREALPDHVEHEVDQSRQPLRPSDVKRYKAKDQQSPRKHQERILDDGKTPRERLDDIREKLGRSREGLDQSGLTGVSDIIGEVIAKGDLDTQELEALAGVDVEKLTERESARLMSPQRQAALRKQREDRTEAERKELQEWMEMKRAEKMKMYKDRRDLLRAAEARPFKSTQDPLVRTREQLRKLQEEREQQKHKREVDFAERRKQLVSDMMGDILADATLDLPEQPSHHVETSHAARVPGSPHTPRRTGRTSAKQTVSHRTVSRSPARAPSRSPVRGQIGMSPARSEVDHDRTRVHVEDYDYIRDSYDAVHHQSRPPVRHSWEIEQERMRNGDLMGQSAATAQTGTMDHTGNTGLTQSGSMAPTQTGSSGIAAYTQHLEKVEESAEFSAEDSSRQPSTAKAPAYKPKPFTAKVRLQRPEVTRKKKGFKTQPLTYTERLSQGSAQGSAYSSTSRASQQRLYGTKRIPGTYKDRMRSAPRTVKTYQDRLREMKQQQPSGPLRVHGGLASPRPQSAPVPRKPKQMPRKTLTYSQQLQQLQPPKDTYRMPQGEGATMSRSAMPRRRKGPPHKPKTYVEQLQELQPPTDTYRKPVAWEIPTRGSVSVRSSLRSRPYADPYTSEMYDDADLYADIRRYAQADGADVEDLSQLSPWSVDRDVQRLLDERASYAAGAATDFELSEMADDNELQMGDDYTALVGVNDIMDAASMSEGSILSYIDWDQIDNLIADVN